MGLLDRANGYQAPVSQDDFVDETFDDFSSGVSLPDTQEFIQNVNELSSDYHFADQIVTLLNKAFPVEKIAFLLINKEQDEYQLWASSCLDETTRHRLRFPSSIFDNFSFPSVPFSIKETEINMLTKYFSYRERLSLDNLLLWPLTPSSNKEGNSLPLGFFLVQFDELEFSPEDDDSLNLIHQFWLDTRTDISTKTELLLNRVQSIKPESDELTDAPALLDAITLFSSESAQRNQPALFLSLDYDPLLEATGQENRTLDLFRFRQVLLSIVTQLFGSNAQCYAFKNNRMIIFLSGRGTSDPELVHFQISSQLSKSIPSLSWDSHLLPFKSFSFPLQGESSGIIYEAITGEEAPL